MKNKHRRTRTKGLDKKSLNKNILAIFNNNSSKLFNYKQIAKRLEIKDVSSKQLITTILRELKEKEYLEEVYSGKFTSKAKREHITGVVDLTASGYAYIVSEQMADDVFVSQKNLNHALHGDTVKVYLYVGKRKNLLEGEVIEIIEMSKRTFVGTVEIMRNFAFLIPDNHKMPYDIFIPMEKLNSANNGDKVVARITDWPKKAKNPFGEITEVLGEPGQNDTEIHAILAEFELPNKFTEEVLQAAEKLSDVISEKEISKRRDFRKVTTFTIDPDDAKDFDDALSVKKLNDKQWEIGVHIADVTHYVRPDTLLENEAFARATSVYLVDRVVSMLPERLSNGMCSLRPNEEKLCFSAVFKIDDEANVLSEWFGRTVIKSNRRFTYDEAQKIIETEEGDFSKETLVLHDIAQKLRKRRFNDGSIAFDREEVKFNIDEEGKPLGVFFKRQKESNQLVEEFMLLANKKVAEYVGKKKENKPAQTMVYRIHDRPNQDKIQAFSQFIKRFGYKMSFGTPKKLSESLNQILSDVDGKREQSLVEILALRAMAKAQYSTKNIGHYGLSFSHYSHFTSPIRRYPDMMTHRLLNHYLQGEKVKNQEFLEKQCKHCSEMELRATNAERASIKFKQVEFMSDKIGQEFDGVISGVAHWGLFVELVENKCEGLVPMRELNDDYYVHDEENYCIVGKQSNKKYQLGDEVRVKIARANLVKKQLDFILVS